MDYKHQGRKGNTTCFVTLYNPFCCRVYHPLVYNVICILYFNRFKETVRHRHTFTFSYSRCKIQFQFTATVFQVAEKEQMSADMRDLSLANQHLRTLLGTAESARLIYESMLSIKSHFPSVFSSYFDSLILCITLYSTRPDLPTVRRYGRWLSNHQKWHGLIVLIT